MTEKRFKLGYVCGDFGLINNDEWIDLHSMSENSEKNVRICINKMNELSEENEYLKQKLDDCQCANALLNNKYEEMQEDILTQIDKIEDLKKENEQLKSYINTLNIGISKILQSIKDDKEGKAMILCIELLKKLEEEDLLE